MLPLSCGQSFKIVLRSKLMQRNIEHFAFPCQFVVIACCGRRSRANFSLVTSHSSLNFVLVEDAIDSFIRFLAVERGLSENYQLSTQRSLSEFAQWCTGSKKIDHPRAVTLPILSEYLAARKDRKSTRLNSSHVSIS